MRSSSRRPAPDWRETLAVFEPNAFAWDESRRAVKSIQRAISSLRPGARASPADAAAVAVLWLARLEDAIVGVDGSSGALANAVKRALDCAIPIIAGAPVDDATRDAWLERLAAPLLEDATNPGVGAGAREGDSLAVIERELGGAPAQGTGERALVHDLLSERWGELCGTPARASAWADRLLPAVRRAWGAEGLHAVGAIACLSALLTAGRNDELLSLLSLRTIACWPERQFGVRALAAAGHVDAAIRYAGASNPLGHHHDLSIASLCESLLLAAGERERAYREFAFAASGRQNCLQTFKALVAKYPEHEPSTILADLIGASPGHEGKWFATARTLRFFQLALEIAARAPCDPRTLCRAASERMEVDPQYALELGLAALRWLIEGHGVEISAADVLEAYDIVMRAGVRLGGSPELRQRLRAEVLRLCELPAPSASWVRELLASELESS